MSKRFGSAFVLVSLLLASCGGPSEPPTATEAGASADSRDVRGISIQQFIESPKLTPLQRAEKALKLLKIKNNSRDLSTQSINVVPSQYTQHQFPNEYYSDYISYEGMDIIDAIGRGEFSYDMQGDLYEEYGGCDPYYDPYCYNAYSSMTPQQLVEQNKRFESKSSVTPQGIYHPDSQISFMKTMFHQSLNNFTYYRNNRYRNDILIWDADGCSIILDTSDYRDFTNHCNRHDFGYRNYQFYRIFTLTNQDHIDAFLLNDMKLYCQNRFGSQLSFGRTACYTDVYAIYGTLYNVAPAHPARWLGKPPQDEIEPY